MKDWTNRRKITILFTAFAVAFAISAGLSQAQGLPLMGNCTSTTTLEKFTTINVSGTDMRISVDEVNCPYGCVENATIYGDDCMDRPINNAYVTYIVIFFAFGVSLIMWRMQGWSFPLIGAIMWLATSLYFLWFINLAIGMVPMVLGILMIFNAIGLIFKEGG